MRTAQRRFVARAIHRSHRFRRTTDEPSIGVSYGMCHQPRFQSLSNLDDFTHFRQSRNLCDDRAFVRTIRQIAFRLQTAKRLANRNAAQVKAAGDRHLIERCARSQVAGLDLETEGVGDLRRYVYTMRQPLSRARALLAAAAALVFFGAVSVPTIRASDGPQTIVHYRLDGSLVRVPVRLNGALLWFDVDTGAPHTVIDAAVVKQLHIAVLRTDRSGGAGRGTVLRQHAVPVDVELGSVHFRVEDPWIFDLRHVGTPLREYGLIGADFFKSHVVRIDPIAETFGVFAPATFRYAGRGSAIPLTDRNDHLFIPMKLSLANGISAAPRVRIDTGSSDAVSDDLVRQSPTRRKSVQGVGLGKAYIDYSGVFSTIQIGPYSIHDAWGPSNTVPTVGMEILRRFVLTFDVARSVLYLDATPRLRDPVPSPAPDR